MNQSFDSYFKYLKKGDHNQCLKELGNWSKEFWKINRQEAPAIFAQRGYEDKGCGHIKGIISNGVDLLEKYSGMLYQLNYPDEEAQKQKSKEEFRTEFFQDLEPNLILFYVSAHLHDIGMKFPGMFKALSELVAGGASHALHIGKIIHDYHHYSSFIVLLELYNRYNSKKNKHHNPEELCPYLFTISQGDQEQESLFEDLQKLFVHLGKIYKKCWTIKKIFEEEEFFVVLAILCLLHKEVNPDYVQSIMRKYKTDLHQQTTLRYFSKWWNSLNNTEAWTKKILKEIPEINNLYKSFSGSKEFLTFPPARRKNNKPGEQILDLLFVEALLQYGDKTEITIDRLVREHEWKQKEGETKIQKSSNPKIPLQYFIEDTEYDNQKGFICTDISQRIISSYARFRACRFIPLALVEVQEDTHDNNGGIAIIFHYLKFPNDENIFKIIRYHNEKDFYDLGFLDIIKIHIPVLLSYYEDRYRENPIMNLEFKKREHELLSLEDMQEKLLANLLKKSKKGKEEKKEKEETQSHNLEIDPNSLFADFLQTKSIRRILKNAVEKRSDSTVLKQKFEEALNVYLDNQKNTYLDKKTEDKKDQEKKKQEKMETLLNDYLDFINEKNPIKDSYNNKTSPAYLMNALYIQLRIGFIYFLESLLKGETGNNSKSYVFADADNEFLEQLNENEKILKGINYLRETVYKESIARVNPGNLFPYTPQNRKAIREFSTSILDPEKRKKAEGIKKVFYETSDLVVPTCFETIAILNLFNEEE